MSQRTVRFPALRLTLATAGAAVFGTLAAFAAATAPQLTRTDISGGPQPNGVVIADFDGDDDLDLATIDRTLKIVKIRRNSGDGLVYANDSVQFTDPPDDLAVGNFDGNAYPDLVVVRGGAFQVILNAGLGGDGKLVLVPQTPVSNADTSVYFSSVATIDLEKDGKDDIAVAINQPAFGGYVHLYKSNGLDVNGFDVHVFDSQLDVGQSATDLASGDLNGDTYADLVATSTLDKRLYYFSNKADGSATLNAGESDRGTNSSLSVAIGDVTGDGKPDVIVGGYENRGTYLAGTVDIYRNLNGANHESGQPSGRLWHEFGITMVFDQITPIPASPLAPGVAVADMNDDGKLDAVMASGETDQLIVRSFTTTTGAGGAFVNLESDGAFEFDAPDQGTNLAVATLDDGDSVDAVVLGLAGTMAVFLGPEGGGGSVDPLDPLVKPASFVLKTKPPYQDGRKMQFEAKGVDPRAREVRVQSTATPGDPASWRDLPNAAQMRNKNGTWGTKSADVTDLSGDRLLSFRALTRATALPDVASDPTPAVSVLARGPVLRLELQAYTATNTNGLFVATGEKISYLVSCKNVGTGPARDVRVIGKPPQRTTFDPTGTSQPFTLEGANFEWRIDTIAPGAVEHRLVTVDVSPNSAPLTVLKMKPLKALADDTATVKSNQFETTILGRLSVEVEASSRETASGEPLVYTLTVRNNGIGTLTNVIVTDIVPEGVFHENSFFLDAGGQVTGSPIANPNGGLNPDVDSNVRILLRRAQRVRWYLGDLPAGESRKLRLDARAKYGLPPGFMVRNTDYDATASDGAEGVRAHLRLPPPVVSRATDGGSVAFPRLSLAQTAFTARSTFIHPVQGEVTAARHGDEIAYVVLYRNDGNATAKDARIYGYFPAGTDFVSGSYFLDGVQLSDTPQELVTANDSYYVKLGDLPGGVNGQFSFVRKVRAAAAAGAPAGGTFITTAKVSLRSPSMYKGVFGAPTELRVFVAKPVEIEIVQTGQSHSCVEVDGTFKLFFAATNRGDLPANDVKAAFETNTRNSIIGASVREAAVPAFAPVSAKYEVALGTLAPGETAGFTIDVLHKTAGNGTTRTYFRCAALGSAIAGKETAPSLSGTVGVIDEVGPDSARLAVAVLSPYHAVNGQPMEQTLVYMNTSTGNVARGAVLYAAIPNGTTFVRASHGGTVSKSPTGSIVTWSLGDIPKAWGGIVTLSLQVDGEPAGCATGQAAILTAGNAPEVFSGRVVTNFSVASFLGFGIQTPECIWEGILGYFRGLANPVIEAEVQKFGTATQNGTIGGTTVMQTGNGVVIAHLGDKNVFVTGPAGFITAEITGTVLVSDSPDHFNRVLVGTGDDVNIGGLLCFGETVSATRVLREAIFVVECKEADILVAGGGMIDPTGMFYLPPGGAPIAIDRAASAGLFAAGSGNLVAAGGGNLVAAGGGNLVAAGGGNLVAAGAGNVVPTGGGSLIGLDSATLVAAGGGNLLGLRTAPLVAAGGLNLVAAGGLNLVAAGGLNLTAKQIAPLVAAGAGNLVGQDGATLVGNDGASLVGQDGGTKR